jgi:hypothetical protein
MAKLTAQQRRDRISFDSRVCMEMDRTCNLLQLEAYASADDLRARRNRIEGPGGSERALHYLATYKPLKTLCGPGEYTNETRIHIDLLANGNYPYSPPASWVVSDKMPWTPHFKKGAVICIGDLWDVTGGKTLLAHLIRHHARLLNWDERARGNGYVGWNGAAIAWHREHYGTSPLTPNLGYPELPSKLVYGIEEKPSFAVGGRGRRQTATAQPPEAGMFRVERSPR